MQIITNDIKDGQPWRSVSTVHGGEELRWSTSTYTKIKFHNLSRLFAELNEHWLSLPEEDQAEIFAAYRDIHDALQEVSDHQEHLKYLRKQVKRIYKYWTAEDVWRAMSKIEVVYPSTMQQAHSNDSNTGRTYLVNDYKNLVHLALAFRPMIPIFGQYNRVVKEISGTPHKETMAVSLLNDTYINDLPAIEKLVQHMEETLTNFPHARTAILGGHMGTASLPHWLASKAAYRRIAIGEVDSGNDISSIITNVFNFVKSVLDSIPRNFGGSVRVKTRTQESSNSEENISFLESLKIREAMSGGHKRLINVYCRDGLTIALRIDPTVPEELVNRCTQLTGSWASVLIQPHQKKLARYVISSQFSPRYLDITGREQTLTLIGVAQALLYHWGYLSLAGLMTAQPIEDHSIAPATSLWARDTLSKEYQDLLQERLPYHRPVVKKDQSAVDLNDGVVAINGIARDIYTSEWVIQEPEWLAKEVPRTDVGTLLIPPDLRNHLARLLLHVTRPTTAA